MADIKWIKISSDIFDNRKIKQIEHMPEGDALIVIWFKLLILAGDTNDGGQVYLTQEIPYTEPLLANQFNRPLTLIQLALRTFEQFEMIEIIDDIIHISNWEKYQNVDGMARVREKTKLRTRAWRERKALCDATVTSQVTGCDIDVTEQNKNEKENENNIVPYGTLVQTEPENIDIRPVNPPKKILSAEQTKRFEAFWKAYPKKQSKATAEKAWSKILPDDFEMNVILTAIEQAKQKDSRFRDMQYIPLPATWLNARSWENEYEDQEPQPQAMARPQRSEGMGSFDADEFLNAAINRRRKG